MDSKENSDVIDIMKEALCIACKIKKLMLPLVLLLFFLSSVLPIRNYISVYPLFLNFIVKLYHLTDEHPTTPELNAQIISIKSDVETFVHTDMVFALALYMLLFFVTMIVACASAITYSEKQVTVQNLVARMGASWKGALVTRICFTLLYIGYTILSISLTTLLLLNVRGSTSLIILGTLFGYFARILYVYLAMVWTVGLVISMLEGDCYGFGALHRAGELVKNNRVVGFVIAVVLLVLNAALMGTYAKDTTEIQRGATQVTGLLVVNGFLLMKIFSSIVFVVFYYGCKKNYSQDFETPKDLSFTSTGSVNEGLP